MMSKKTDNRAIEMLRIFALPAKEMVQAVVDMAKRGDTAAFWVVFNYVRRTR